MKKIYSGLESSGKSLYLAREAERVLLRNGKWFKRSGIARPIRSNLTYSPWFMAKAEELKIPVVIWEDLDEIVGQSNCDIFIDEVGTYFDSRTWTDLSLPTRRWIAQAAKLGVEIYGAAQDFAQIDIAFRRLVNELWYIKKLIGSPRPANTRPPVKRIWGLCMMRDLDPRSYSETDNEFKTASFIPKFFVIRRHDCELFDTSQLIRRSRMQPLLHEERRCPDCGFEKISHK
jgi:hypothetical protein